MTDSRLRDLERRWAATREPSDEVALLVERLRAGVLPAAMVQLAAYLGDPAARAVTGAGETPPPLETWVAGLERWGTEWVLHAGLAAARAAHPRWAAHRAADLRPERALDAADALVRCPCRRHMHEARLAGSEACLSPVGTPEEIAALIESALRSEGLYGFDEDELSPAHGGLQGRIAAAAARAAASAALLASLLAVPRGGIAPTIRGRPGGAGALVWREQEPDPRAQLAALLLSAAEALGGEDAVRAAVRDDLVPRAFAAA